MRKLLLLPFSLFILSCNQTKDPAQTKEPLPLTTTDTIRIIKDFKGVYKNNGTPTFIDCEHPEMIYRIKDGSGLDDSVKKLLPNAYAREAIYAEINAEVSSIDSKVFAEQLEIKKILKTEQKNFMNTCVPYDFWCKGNEPFWQLQISKTEKLIDFYDPMTQKTTHFLYAEPHDKDGATVYSSAEENNPKNKIQIYLYKEKCSDGMSDKQYNYRTEVIMDKRYKGCAVKFGEK
jgi:uncharacterized membrane protein